MLPTAHSPPYQPVIHIRAVSGLAAPLCAGERPISSTSTGAMTTKAPRKRPKECLPPSLLAEVIPAGSESTGLSSAGVTTSTASWMRPAGRSPRCRPASKTRAGSESTAPLSAGATYDRGLANSPHERFTAVSSGDFHSCGLRADSTVRCWHWTSSLPEGVEWHSAIQAPTEPVSEQAPIQAVYVVPQDVEMIDSREKAILFVVSEVQRWFRSQTDGRHPIFEDIGWSLSVVPVRLPHTASELRSESIPIRSEIYKELGAESGTPILIFYEGEYGDPDSCGWATVQYVMIPMENCSIYPERGGWPYGSSYLVAHELTHLLGAVGSCAPNYDGDGHVNDDNRDVIYAGPQDRDWENLVLDANNDDYYLHGRDDCYDIANNPLLVKE